MSVAAKNKRRRGVDEDYVALRNNSNRPQHIFDTEGEFSAPGTRHVIEAHMVKMLPGAIANAFLAKRPLDIVRYRPRLPALVPGEDVVYVANGTGNPFAPKKVVTVVLDEQKREKKVEIDNPLAVPRVVSLTMKGAQRVVTNPHTKGRKTMYTHQPTTFELPPYTCMAVSVSQSRWLMQRIKQNERGNRGEMFMCREPTAFEPNETWSLDDMQMYAKLLDIKQLLAGGDHEAMLGLRDEAGVLVAEDDYPSVTEAYNTKMTLMAALFHVIRNQHVELPTQTDFDNFLAIEKAAADIYEEKRRADARKRAKQPTITEATDAAPAGP